MGCRDQRQLWKSLGDHLQECLGTKLADGLYCGGETPEELLRHWIRVRTALDACGLRLSATKTIICPRSTTVSGWIWTQGRLSTSTNKVSVLSRCKLPDFALGLRSFIPRQNLKIPKKLNLPPSNERWPFIDHYWWFCEQAWNRNNAILDAWR